MIIHLFKLVWNRKKTNFLVTVEIFFAFLVICGLTTLGVYYYSNYQQPLGFNYENVWNIAIDAKQGMDRKWTKERAETLEQLYKTLRAFEEVEKVGGAGLMAYQWHNWVGSDTVPGNRFRVQHINANDDFHEAMQVEVTRGRWFDKSDDAMNWRPVVINEYYAKLKFGNQNPVGKRLREPNPESKDAFIEQRVVGVVSNFRKDGEFADLESFCFTRTSVADSLSSPPMNIVVRVRAGTTAAFEEKMIKALERTAKDWSFKASPVSVMRKTFLKRTTVPLITLSLVAGFLVLMVALGLVGVVWQNVTARTREIGLRRAAGATGGNIYNQILGELLVIASIGLVIGVLVVVQFPLLKVMDFVMPQIYLYGLLISLAFVYLVTIVCGLYPSWLATKVQPTEALHYE